MSEYYQEKCTYNQSLISSEFFKKSEICFYISEFQLEAYFVQYLC